MLTIEANKAVDAWIEIDTLVSAAYDDGQMSLDEYMAFKTEIDCCLWEKPNVTAEDLWVVAKEHRIEKR